MLDPSEVEAVRDQIARGNPDAFQRILRAFGLPLRSYIAAQIHHQSDVDGLQVGDEVGWYVMEHELLPLRSGKGGQDRTGRPQ